MTPRVLTAVNVALILISAACLVYLATARYEKPADIVAWEQRRATPIEPAGDPTGETGFSPGGVATLPNLNKSFMMPLFTPTPTPTPPPPAPTPTPNLLEAVAPWQIVSLNPDSIDAVDPRTQETFTLSVGGPPKESRDNRGLPVMVKLESVDLETLTATFSFGPQRASKNF